MLGRKHDVVDCAVRVLLFFPCDEDVVRFHSLNTYVNSYAVGIVGEFVGSKFGTLICLDGLRIVDIILSRGKAESESNRYL